MFFTALELLAIIVLVIHVYMLCYLKELSNNYSTGNYYTGYTGNYSNDIYSTGVYINKTAYTDDIV
jgi:hypothetical protein